VKVTASWLYLSGFFSFALLTASPVPATETEPTGGTRISAASEASQDETAVHNQLRALRDAIMEAWNKRDIDAVLTHVDPNVVVTWQNGEVNRGPEAIRKFYKEMLEGDGRIISNIASKLRVDDLSVLHGEDTAIAFGSIHDDISFNKSVAAKSIGAGDAIALDSRWTATLVRKAGEWKLASYHVSSNLFSNPVTDLEVKAAGRLAAITGFAIGAVAVLLLVWVLRGRKRAGPAG
jgi:uncharacterized protein (TIGR02246 family)